MTETPIEKLTKTPEGMRLYQQERTIGEMGELIFVAMQDQGVSKEELSRRLTMPESYVTSLLSGYPNVPNKGLRSLSDIFTALGRSLHFSTGPLEV